MRVGEHDVGREGTEDHITQLDAPLRDDIAEGEVVLAQELREVMKEDQ